MNELEYMRREGKLLTEKQYKRYMLTMFISLITSGILTCIGFILMIVSTSTTNDKLGYLGGLLTIVGFISLIISSIISFKSAGKIRLYRHYKKHPEDFAKDINN